MSKEAYDDDCQGCKPALINLKTKVPLPDTDPKMQTIFRLWKTLTTEEKQAFHRVICQNSKTSQDLKVFLDIGLRMQKVLKTRLLVVPKDE